MPLKVQGRYTARALVLARLASRRGIGLTELIVALVIISMVVLSMGAVLPNSLRTSTQSHVDFLALNAVDERIAMIQMDPRFPVPDSIYAEVGTELDALPGLRRTTLIEEVEDRPLQRITVRVTAPALRGPVVRTVEVGEP